MVNSGSFDSADGNRNGKTRCTQTGDAALGSQPSDSDDAACKSDCSKSADGDLPSDESAIEPTPTKTEINSNLPSNAPLKCESFGNDGLGLASLSLPLEKIQSAANISLPENGEDKAKQARKLLCLYCDRSFVSANLRQKHVERVHSVKHLRRVSARRQNQLSTTPCAHCDKLNASEHTLSDLFQHLVQEHPTKYFGCLSCAEKFLTSVDLADHNRLKHSTNETSFNTNLLTTSQTENVVGPSSSTKSTQKVTRSKLRCSTRELGADDVPNFARRKKKSKLKELRNKKISVKSSKIAIKRSKRLQQQAKEVSVQKKRREKKLPTSTKLEVASNTKQPEKSKTACVNPFPEFDHFYRVKKITDHSIDNLKISSLTFDDVFDKAFFNRIKCNIEENLLHHIDGKLFKNEESESRISNFEKVSTASQEVQNANADNYGCDISLNAITPASSLSLNSQFGEDFESQIEYGSKPSKKRTQIKSDEVHYKYFTRRKYQASILQQKENRDLSKLDMWTQMVVKDRQERVLNKKKSAKEIQEYTTCQEYRSKIKREELNRILDRRGPFEDLKEEASKKAAFDKLNSSSDNNISQEVFTHVREVLNDLLDRVFEAVSEEDDPLEDSYKEIDHREIPAYLDLRRKTSSTQEEIDKSDRIALICSSQETENFELPTNTVRSKNELVELTGEWARSRMYICAACGGKFSNMRYLVEHKSLYHQNVWVQHYEFVGNQGELYRHLSIPGLGKVGIVEETVPCKQWKRSDARTCTKCGKQCNALGELHRHVLECGGDWTWMLARKKCKYRPFGAKTRRKLRGFEPRIHNKRKTEPSEKKKYKKPIDGPRQRPSDADTIQRMLANLPPKRSRRSIISLSDVVFKSRKSNNNANNKKHSATKVKCGKALRKKQQSDSNTHSSNQQRSSRTLRSFNKVLSSRILDLNSSLLVKRKIKVLRNHRLTRKRGRPPKNYKEDTSEKVTAAEVMQAEKKRKSPKKDASNFKEPEKCEPPTENKSVAKRMLNTRLNLKNFFPVKKKNLRQVQKSSETDKISTDSNDFNKSSKYLDNFQHMKKNKRGGLKGFVRALSLRKRNSKEEEEVENAASKNIEVLKKDIRSKLEEKDDEESPKSIPNSDSVSSEELSKKRKLQRSFRNVINRVKKIKTENTTAKKSKKENLENPFLGEGAMQKDSPPPDEAKESVQGKKDLAPTVSCNLSDSKENPPIPETIFNLAATSEEKNLQAKGELDFDVKHSNITDTGVCPSNSPLISDTLENKTNSIHSDLDNKISPVAIDTSLKPKCVPLVSPNVKGKIRKPSRGLNDCIAMLTSKLQQKEDKMSSSLESLFSTSSTTSIEPRTERPILDVPKMLPKPENVPKISVSLVEETALDLSKKSVSTPNLLISNPEADNFLENKNDNLPLNPPTWNSVDDIIQQVVHDSSLYLFNKPKKNAFVSRTKVDDTIDFVVSSSLDWFESKQPNAQNNVKHQKKTKRKKHFDDNLITNIIFGKDKLIIAPSSDFQSPLIAKIKENEYRMSHLLSSSSNNVKAAEKETVQTPNISGTPVGVFESSGVSQNDSNQPLKDKELLTTNVVKENASLESQSSPKDAKLVAENETSHCKPTSGSSDSEIISQGKQNESVENCESVKATPKKEKNKKRGKIKNEKPVIETDLDNCMNVKEVSTDDKHKVQLNISDKERKIELITESEPVLLENKTIQKPLKLSSDSEDEIPLAIIAKSDDSRLTKQTVSEMKKCTNNVRSLKYQLPSSKTNVAASNDNKDIVETLTTDSLKENIEESTNIKEANKLSTGHTHISKILKRRRRKKRRKLLIRNKKRVAVKKSTIIKANNCKILQVQEEPTLLTSTTLKNKDLPFDELSKNICYPAAAEVPANTEHPVDTESKTPGCNSQRTRRKSKSSKKIDKTENDLFKNFSLVINKKTKRIPPTSIVDDSVCDDILDASINFFVKPSEISKEPDVAIDPPLNDSVEEMDMEIEDIPINTSIIERDDKQLVALSSYNKDITFPTNDGQKPKKENNSTGFIEFREDIFSTKIAKVELDHELLEDEQNLNRNMDYLNISLGSNPPSFEDVRLKLVAATEAEDYNNPITSGIGEMEELVHFSDKTVPDKLLTEKSFSLKGVPNVQEPAGKLGNALGDSNVNREKDTLLFCKNMSDGLICLSEQLTSQNRGADEEPCNQTHSQDNAACKPHILPQPYKNVDTIAVESTPKSSEMATSTQTDSCRSLEMTSEFERPLNESTPKKKRGRPRKEKPSKGVENKSMPDELHSKSDTRKSPRSKSESAKDESGEMLDVDSVSPELDKEPDASCEKFVETLKSRRGRRRQKNKKLLKKPLIEPVLSVESPDTKTRPFDCVQFQSVNDDAQSLPNNKSQPEETISVISEVNGFPNNLADQPLTTVELSGNTNLCEDTDLYSQPAALQTNNESEAVRSELENSQCKETESEKSSEGEVVTEPEIVIISEPADSRNLDQGLNDAEKILEDSGFVEKSPEESPSKKQKVKKPKKDLKTREPLIGGVDIKEPTTAKNVFAACLMMDDCSKVEVEQINSGAIPDAEQICEYKEDIIEATVACSSTVSRNSEGAGAGNELVEKNTSSSQEIDIEMSSTECTEKKAQQDEDLVATVQLNVEAKSRPKSNNVKNNFIKRVKVGRKHKKTKRKNSVGKDVDSTPLAIPALNKPLQINTASFPEGVDTFNKDGDRSICVYSVNSNLMEQECLNSTIVNEEENLDKTIINMPTETEETADIAEDDHNVHAIESNNIHHKSNKKSNRGAKLDGARKIKTSCDEIVLKSRRPRKVIDYNEDNLEKRALEVNKSLATQNTKMKKEKTSLVKNNKTSKKTDATNDNFSEKGTSDTSANIHNDMNNKLVNESDVADKTADLEVVVHADANIENCDTYLNLECEQNFERASNPVEMPPVNDESLVPSMKDDAGKHDIKCWEPEPVAYKASDFSEIPKLVVDIHHTDQIDHKLQEHAVRPDLPDLVLTATTSYSNASVKHSEINEVIEESRRASSTEEIFNKTDGAQLDEMSVKSDRNASVKKRNRKSRKDAVDDLKDNVADNSYSKKDLLINENISSNQATSYSNASVEHSEINEVIEENPHASSTEEIFNKTDGAQLDEMSVKSDQFEYKEPVPPKSNASVKKRNRKSRKEAVDDLKDNVANNSYSNKDLLINENISSNQATSYSNASVEHSEINEVIEENPHASSTEEIFNKTDGAQLDEMTVKSDQFEYKEPVPPKSNASVKKRNRKSRKDAVDDLKDNVANNSYSKKDLLINEDISSNQVLEDSADATSKSTKYRNMGSEDFGANFSNINGESELETKNEGRDTSSLEKNQTSNEILSKDFENSLSRYNRRPRKNINYNEEVLLNALESVSNNGVPTKRKRKSINSLDPVDEEGHTNNTIAQDKVEDQLNGKIFEVNLASSSNLEPGQNLEAPHELQASENKRKAKKNKKRQDSTLFSENSANLSVTNDLVGLEQTVTGKSEGQINALWESAKKGPENDFGLEMHKSLSLGDNNLLSNISEIITREEESINTPNCAKGVDDKDIAGGNFRVRLLDETNEKLRNANGDADVSILGSESASRNSHSSRKEKALVDGAVESPLENTALPENEAPPSDNNHSLSESYQHTNNNELPQTCTLEQTHNESTPMLNPDILGNHLSGSNESPPLLQRLYSLQNKLDSDDNKSVENTLSLNGTKSVLDVVSSTTDCPPSPDDFLVIDERESPLIDKMEDVVLENKSLPALKKHKKRKTIKSKLGKNKFKPHEIIIKQPKNNSIYVDNNSEHPERQCQLAKINIKNLLLSSLAPPDSKYIPPDSNRSKLAADNDELNVTTEIRLKHKKDSTEAFSDSFQDNINFVHNNKSLLNEGLTFTALKDVLNTFTNSCKTNAFTKSDSMFSEIQPLSEIITSSEMDIAPVLDEIDKSLECDDVYDFTEDIQGEPYTNEKQKITKNKSKNRKLCPKAETQSTEEVELKRASSRSAKVKALESIHEKVLTESHDAEQSITSSTHSKKSKKRSKKAESNPTADRALEEVTTMLSIPSLPHEPDLKNESEITILHKNQPAPLEDVGTDTRPPEFAMESNQNIDNSQEGTPSEKLDEDGAELRRSRRGSRKIASYNENDLIDPLIDALEKRRSRSSRKDRSTEKQQIKIDSSKEPVNDKPKLSSEELFDLLKHSSFESDNVKHEHNSSGAYQDKTEVDLDNIPKAPPPAKLKDVDKIYEFTEDSPENTEEIKELFSKNKKKPRQQSLTDEIKITADVSSCTEGLYEKESNDSDQDKSNYCEICKKSFIRLENLIKHKTTLTHISKLSELEAKAAEEKAKLEKQPTPEHLNSSSKTTGNLKDEINLTDILQQAEQPQATVQEDSAPLHNNHSLKLVDIINDVLNKPVIGQDFSACNLQNNTKKDVRRYKSLGERKSFESENQLAQINAAYLPPALSQTSILENQINLLENIIGNNLENITSNKGDEGNNFIDEVSSCSNVSNTSDLDNNSCTTIRSVVNVNSENVELNCEADFIKPTQYEEISEDSANARVYEDPKQRKTLNRDEELFLECCSLLKSGSEVSNSNYSKHVKKPLGCLKEFDEPDLMENKKLIQTAEEAHEYSDNSRTPTPLGDTYDDDASNSNTISSNWHLKSEKPMDENRSFSFEEVKSKEAAGMPYGEMLTKGLRNQFENIAKANERSPNDVPDLLERHLPTDDRKDDSDSSTASKKVATKGARKVYEGLKVSIPTEDLDLEVLNSSPLNKKSDVKTDPAAEEYGEQTRSKPRSTRKSKPVKKSQVGSNLLFKVNKKKSSTQLVDSTTAEQQDVYNFEETQDNTDIFIKPTLKDSNSTEPEVKKVNMLCSDNESLGYADSIGADAKSVSSVSSVSAMSMKKPEVAPENITKKKYKIMGKIFRNAAKSKMEDIDEELRSIPEIPEIDNLELVENYVRSCQRVKSPFLPPPPPPPIDDLPKKPKMTEEEMNMLFDQLLGKEVSEQKPERTINKSVPKVKNGDNKKKNGKVKNRKRARGHSESSDDEFNINRAAKKRSNKKNNQEDSGINLELELKECIGVASRKSQRTCTSGKQNILVEYWSSDEEAFEAMLESHKISSKKDEDKKKKVELEAIPKKPTGSEVFEKPSETAPKKPAKKKKSPLKKSKSLNTKVSEANDAATAASNRRKRAAVNPLYHWSSSSEDESQSLIEVKPIREEDDEDDRPIQHGWIVGDSPKKLVTMLALTKGKKTDIDCVKEQGKKRTSNTAS